MTITHEALDLTAQPPTPALPLDIRTGPTLLWPSAPSPVKSDGHHWGPVQNCSFEDLPGSDIWWWLLKHIRSARTGGTHPTGMPSDLIVRYMSVSSGSCVY